MEVEFVTLGDASERLNVPSPTLRNWTDQLEEHDIHYVKRNSRNERIYYDNDISIFSFIRDLKQEYGRRTTMKDIVAMLKDRDDRFELRSQEDAPAPVAEPSNKTSDLIHPEDFERLLENQRVRALVNFVVGQTSNSLRGEILEEIQFQWEKDREILKEAVRKEVKEEIAVSHENMLKELHTLEEERKKREIEEKERLEKRDKESMQLLKQLLEQRKKENEERLEREQKERDSKGFFAKLFKK